MLGREDDLLHTGIATFTGADYVKITDVKKYDVAVLGVPDEMGATYRLGMQYAPRAVREHSMWKRIDGIECYDYDNEKYVKTNKLKICDLGDLDIYAGNQEKTLDSLSEVAETIRKTTFPVFIGGDHSITYGSFKGVKKGGKYKKLGLLQFDAHNDTEPDYEYFPKILHSNQFTHLINEGYLDGNNMVTIGVRGIVNRVWHDFAIEKGITHITANRFNKMEKEDVLKILREKFADCDGIYVTFDMDSLDVAYSEGVGTPKYNGIDFMKSLDIIRALKEFNIVAFDEVELNPLQDASGITSFMAWEVLYNFLALGLNKGEK